jgi:hypothetical protein
MRMRALTLVFLILLPIGVIAQQAQISTNSAGDYVIRFDVGGTPQEFTFERATHIRPTIRVTVAPDRGAFTYRYTLANGAGARQDIHSFTLTGVSSATVEGAPEEWEGDAVPQRARMYWMRLSKLGRRGVSPGASVDRFVLRSTLLPGPANAELRGNTEVPKITPVVPESALRQLRKLMERDFVTAVTIAPVISGFGAQEPELTTAVFLARVKSRFAVPLIRSDHSDAELLLSALDAAIAAAESGSDVISQIRRVEQIARRGPLSPFVRELNEALLLNLEHARSHAP